MTTRNEDGSQGYCGFVVGQHVVCIGHTFADEKARNRWIRRGVTFPDIGKVYTVRRVLLLPYSTALLLDEIRNPIVRCREAGDQEAFFRASCFRPLQKLKVEDFLSTKTPVDSERVPA